MKRRHFILALGAASLTLLTGCDNKQEKLVGYWLQETDNRPISMHIKPDGKDFLVNINQLNFGRFSRDIEKGIYKGDGILTIGEKKQIKYQEDSDSISDVDDKSIYFKRVTEEKYKAASTR